MNRQAPGATRSTPTPLSNTYRSAQPTSTGTTAPNSSMYYATAGAQATSQQPQASSRGPTAGGLPAGYPSVGGPRGAPPGFGSRATGDQGDFPALGSHATSSYANQTQPGQYLSQQPLASGLQPPGPPPGISAPTSASAGGGGASVGGQSQTNGSRDDGDDFPALGGGQRGGGGGPGSVVSDSKDRLSSYMRNPSQHTQAPPSPPSTLPNGAASGSHSATPSQPPHPPPHLAGDSASWLRESQSRTPSRGMEQISRPAQQILTSPVDQWGLQALLYEIKMGKSMMFSEDLGDLGIDMNSEEPLYPTFVTPWVDPSQRTHPVTIEENWAIPSHYMVSAPPMSSKLGLFTEDTLFYIFYTQPQDVAQLESAEELYNRGWRYHIPSQTWMSSPLLAGFDPRDNPSSADVPAFHGPFVIFDQNNFKRVGPQTLQISPNDFEVPRTAHSYLVEESARNESLKSPNGSATGQSQTLSVR